MSDESIRAGNRRLRRLGLALLCVLAMACLAAPALAAAKPLTGTFAGAGVGRRVTFSHGGRQHNDWSGVLKLKLDDGPTVSVFCIQLEVSVRSGDRYRSDGPVLALPNGCQIRYLLDKYPASSAKTADEAAARQLAIWVFSDGLDPSTIGDATVRDRAIALVNEAKGKPCPTRRVDAPDLSIQPPVATAPPGQAVAYTIRAGALDAGQPVTLAVTGPAALADAQKQPQGQQLTVTLDAQGNATFWLLGASAGQSTISATLPYRLEAGTVFSHIDAKTPTQRLVLAERQNLTAKASARATWSSSAPPVTSPPVTSPPKQPPAEQPPAEQPPADLITTALVEIAKKASEQPAPAAPAPPAAPPAPAAPPPAEQSAAPPAASPPAPPPDVVRPRELPRTGGRDDLAPALLATVAALCAGGWWLRRRALR
jgi:hypothetical protein